MSLAMDPQRTQRLALLCKRSVREKLTTSRGKGKTHLVAQEHAAAPGAADARARRGAAVDAAARLAEALEVDLALDAVHVLRDLAAPAAGDLEECQELARWSAWGKNVAHRSLALGEGVRLLGNVPLVGEELGLEGLHLLVDGLGGAGEGDVFEAVVDHLQVDGGEVLVFHALGAADVPAFSVPDGGCADLEAIVSIP